MKMETITAQDGTLIPVNQILEIRPQDKDFIVATRLRDHRVDAVEMQGILNRPKRTVTKRKAA